MYERNYRNRVYSEYANNRPIVSYNFAPLRMGESIRVLGRGECILRYNESGLVLDMEGRRLRFRKSFMDGRASYLGRNERITAHIYKSFRTGNYKLMVWRNNDGVRTWGKRAW